MRLNPDAASSPGVRCGPQLVRRRVRASRSTVDEAPRVKMSPFRSSQLATELFRPRKPASGMMALVVRRTLLVSLLVGLAACSSPASVPLQSLGVGAVVFGGGDRLHVRIA